MYYINISSILSKYSHACHLWSIKLYFTQYAGIEISEVDNPALDQMCVDPSIGMLMMWMPLAYVFHQ